MADLWSVWRVVAAGVAIGLVLVLLARHIFEGHIKERVRRLLDIVAIPLLVVFLVYIATDFLRPLP